MLKPSAIKFSKNVSSLIFVVSSLVLSGCASNSVRMDVDLPATDVDSVASPIRIEAFTSTTRDLGTQISSLIESGLAREGYVDVVQNGGKAQLTGEVNLSRLETNRDSSSHQVTVKEDGKKRKETRYTYTYNQKMNGTLNYRLKQGSRVLATNSFEVNFDETNSGSSSGDARQSAKTESQIINSILNQLARKVVTGISPHKATVAVDLMLGGSQGIGGHKSLKLGKVYMENGRSDQAISIWQQALNEPKLSDKDKASLLYNIGVVYEAKSKFVEAFQNFSRADQTLPGNKTIISAFNRVEGKALSAKKFSRQVNTGTKSRSARTTPTCSDDVAPEGKFCLKITTQPSNARIRIMNIAPKYQSDIALIPGRYDVKIDASGYQTHREWVVIESENVVIDISLESNVQ